jgi:hypothetical protein
LVQTCIVHLIRNSLRFVPDKHRKKVAADLRPIYPAIDADHALKASGAFDAEWGQRYPMITRTWRDSQVEAQIKGHAGPLVTGVRADTRAGRSTAQPGRSCTDYQRWRSVRDRRASRPLGQRGDTAPRWRRRQ